MTWANVDDLFPEHPKVLAAGGDAAWLYICGLCFVNRNLTEGRVPKNVVARLSDRKAPAKLASRLVEVGLWHDDGDTYRIHDWEKYNETAETVKAKREQARHAAQTRWAKRSGAIRNAPGNAPPADEQCDEHAARMPSAYADAMPPHSSPTPSTNSSSSIHQSVGPPGAEEEELRTRKAIAARLVAERRLKARNGEPITDRAGWLRKVAARVLDDHGPALTDLADRGLNAAAMADAVDPSVAPSPHRAWEAPADETDEDPVVAADDARRKLAELRRGA